MKKSVLIYIVLTTVLAVTLIVCNSSLIPQSHWGSLIFLIIIAVALEMTAIRLPSGPVVSLSSGLSMVALFSFGLPLAIWSTAISVLCVALIQRWQYYKVLFNTSQYILSVFVAGWLFHLSGGIPGWINISRPLPFITAVFGYFVVNSSLTSILFSFLQDMNVFSVWLRMINGSYQTYLAVQLLALISTYTFIFQGAIGLLILVAFLLLLQIVFRNHYELLEKAQARAQELEAVLNATESGILLIDDELKVKVFNRHAFDILGVPYPENVDSRVSASSILMELSGKLTVPEKMHKLLSAREDPVSEELHILYPEKKTIKGFAAPIFDHSNNYSGGIITLTDITQEMEKSRQLAELYESAIRSLAAAIDARDSYTSGHSNRVSDLAVSIAEAMEFPDEEITVLRYAALLHDIGKIGIDDKILRKEGPLNSEERVQMIAHPEKGVTILEQVNAFQRLIPFVKYHHEWFGGGGYPCGIKGEEIPLCARIISVADAFDAMTSKRSYRDALPVQEAVRRLRKGESTQFDPQVVQVFLDKVLKFGVEGEKNLEEHVNTFPPEQVIQRASSKVISNPKNDLQVVRRTWEEAVHKAFHSNSREPLNELLNALAQLNSGSIYLFYVLDEKKEQFILEAASETVDYYAYPSYFPSDMPSLKEVMQNKRVETGCIKPIRLCKQEEEGSLLFNEKKQFFVPVAEKGEVVGLLVVLMDIDGEITQTEIQGLPMIAQCLLCLLNYNAAHEALRYAASYDYMTGVYNRLYFDMLISEKILQQKEKVFSIAVIDINGLKEINDTIGHLAGDEAIKQFARILERHIEGCIARYGGDEFVLLCESGMKECLRNIEILCNVLQNEFYNYEGSALPMPSIACGVAVFPTDGQSLTSLINVADQRMYSAKKMQKKTAKIS